MRRFIMSALVAVTAIGVLFSLGDAQQGDKKSIVTTSPNASWYFFSFDADIDTALEFVDELDSFVQMDGTDKIEIVSAQAADTKQRLRITGISKFDSTLRTEYMRTNGTTVVTSVDSFYAFEHAVIDSGVDATGAITIRNANGDATIATITIGQTQTYEAQKFFMRGSSGYVTQWTAGVTSTTGTVKFELRAYPDYTDVRDMGDGYAVVDVIMLPAALGGETHVFNPPRLIDSAYGFLTVFAIGGANNSDGYVSVEGYTRSAPRDQY